MAKWFRVEALMHNVKDEEQNARLGIQSEEAQVIVRPLMIDLKRIETYTAMVDEEGDPIKDQTMISTYSGLEMVIKIGFNAFDRLVKENTQED